SLTRLLVSTCLCHCLSLAMPNNSSVRSNCSSCCGKNCLLVQQLVQSKHAFACGPQPAITGNLQYAFRSTCAFMFFFNDSSFTSSTSLSSSISSTSPLLVTSFS